MKDKPRLWPVAATDDRVRLARRLLRSTAIWVDPMSFRPFTSESYAQDDRPEAWRDVLAAVGLQPAGGHSFFDGHATASHRHAAGVALTRMTLVQELFTTTCDWRVASLGWMYTLFFVLLGIAAAVWGGWLERVGPRKAGLVSALCWCGGLFLGAIGVYTHQLWLLWLGSGVIGGIGLGIGYISPVSTLVKWFPDRRGMIVTHTHGEFGHRALFDAAAPVLPGLERAASFVF